MEYAKFLSPELTLQGEERWTNEYIMYWVVVNANKKEHQVEKEGGGAVLLCYVSW